MPIIGNPIYQSAFVVDQFSGNGSTTAFTMSVAPAGVTNVLVAVSGVLQDPSTYGVVGNTITFSAAPPSGTGNISCRYLGVPVTGVTTTAYRTVTEFTATASQTTFTPPSYNVGFINVYLNGVLLGSADYTASNGTTVVLATGASAGNLVTVESFQISSVLNALPQTGGTVSGVLNLTSLLTLSGSAGTAGQVLQSNGPSANPTWVSLPYAVDYLAVAGGGAGASEDGGGGGAGGYVASVFTVVPSTAYSIVIGAGGTGSSSRVRAASGSNTTGLGITAIGGGGGGADTGGSPNQDGGAGGSGGGGAGNNGAEGFSAGTGGASTSGQGNAGGNGQNRATYGELGGGGGGASAAGTSASVGTAGSGGAGNTWLNGTTYAGGGGGGASQVGSGGTAGAGGAGGGGNGSNSGNGTSGTANTGGGGGGSGNNAGNTGGSGGSGIFIIRYYGSQKGTGGTITSAGGYTYHTFTSSGTYTA